MTTKLHVPDVLRRPLMLSGWYKATAARKGPAQRRNNLGNFIISPLVYFIRSSVVLPLSWTKQLRIRATAGKQTIFWYFTMDSYHSTSSLWGAVQLSGCSTWLRNESFLVRLPVQAVSSSLLIPTHHLLFSANLLFHSLAWIYNFHTLCVCVCVCVCVYVWLYVCEQKACAWQTMC